MYQTVSLPGCNSCVSEPPCAAATAVCHGQGYITGHRQEMLQNQLDAMLDRYDQDDDGEISFEEFINLFEEQLA